MGDTSLDVSPQAVKRLSSTKPAKASGRTEDDEANTSIITTGTAESDDPLADTSAALSSEGEVTEAVYADDGAASDISEGEEDEEEEDASEDEETETEEESEDEEEEEEEEESGSSFAESDAESVSSVEPSPPRRTSTKKARQTVSPAKRRQTATPSKKEETPPKRVKAPQRLMSPLSETTRQNEVQGVSSDEDEEVVKPKAKTKKR